MLTIHPASNGKYLGVEKMPWGDSIRLTSSGVNTPEIQTEVLLFNDKKRIEFRYHVNKKYTTAQGRCLYCISSGGDEAGI